MCFTYYFGFEAKIILLQILYLYLFANHFAQLQQQEKLYLSTFLSHHCLASACRLTLGSDALDPELCVVIVSTVVMPRPTLAGAASMFIQKDTHESMTMRREGMYIWIK